VNSSAAEIGNLTAGGALIGCMANSYMSATTPPKRRWSIYLIALQIEMTNSLGSLDLFTPYVPIISTAGVGRSPGRLGTESQFFPCQDTGQLTQYRVYKFGHWLHQRSIS
jgi:hypothetical protein